jgi:hypothetical protein
MVDHDLVRSYQLLGLLRGALEYPRKDYAPLAAETHTGR